MTSGKILSCLVINTICLLLLTAGCAGPGEEAVKPEAKLKEPIPEPVVVPVEPEIEPVEQVPEVVTEGAAVMALKFKPEDSTTYKLTTRTEDGVKFEGSLSDDPNFRNRTNSRKLEMTFTQQIQSISDEGNATAKITIEGLKYLAIQNNKTVLNFDSSGEKDKGNPLMNLIGQSYTIEISPTGEVTRVVDVKQAREAIRGTHDTNKIGLALLSADAIKRNHKAFDLPKADKNRLQTGDNWSSVRTFDFRHLGMKVYERIYTLKEIKDTGNRRLATVEMEAIPTSDTKGLEDQITSTLAGMFDNVETYSGQLKLDMTCGKVEEYVEQLKSEWIAVDPEAQPEEGDQGPDAIRMGVVRSYKLEKMD